LLFGGPQCTQVAAELPLGTIMGENCHCRSGHLDRQLDPKGRFSLPVDWRPAYGENVFFVKVKVEGIPALRVLTQTAFDRKLGDIENTQEANPAQKDRARGILYGSVIASKVNEQGKLAIPKALAEANGFTLPGAVHLVGRGELFEIFTPQNGEAIEAAEQKAREDDPVLSGMLGF
jgi:DNA-binding transcriptional regulator/RsmH inhibitor MraZ